MVDVPDGLEDISEVVIFGVESEQIEEENDAYNDLRAELGTDGIKMIVIIATNMCHRHCQGGRG